MIILSANDGNRPKDHVLKILDRKGGIPVGDIGPVNRGLKELLQENRHKLFPESIRLLEACTGGASDDTKKPQEQPESTFGAGHAESNGPKKEEAPSVLKFFGLEAPYIPKEIRWGNKDNQVPGLITPELIRRSTELIHRAAMLGPDVVRHVLESAGIEKNYPGPITPELMDMLFGKTNGKEDNPVVRRTIPAEELAKRRERENIAPPSGTQINKAFHPSKATKIIFDPRTGKPIPKGIRTPEPASPDIADYLDFKPKTFHPVRKMLDKDKRLNEADKDAITDAVTFRHCEFGKDGRSLGDIVREEVERHLANKKTLKTTLQIDAEAGVRILELHFENMIERRFEEVNPDNKQATEAEVLAAIDAIPKSRLHELSLSGITIKSLMKCIVDYTVYHSARKAIEEKLQG